MIFLIIIIISLLLLMIYFFIDNRKEYFDISKIDINDFDYKTKKYNPQNYKQIIYTIILKKAKTALDRLNIPFFLSSGTLLGYYRENKFIDHDYDIDIGIYAEDYRDQIISEMKKEGLIYYRTLGDPINGMEMSFRLPYTRLGRLAKLDLFLHYQSNDKIYWFAFAQWRKNKKIKYQINNFQLKEINFMNLNVNVPYPTEKYLEEHYGKDWRIPKKPFKEYSFFKSPISIVNN